MPVILLTEEQETHAASLADSDLKYLLADVGVPEHIQYALFHRGYTSIRLFAGIDESRTEVRAAVTSEIGLDQTANNAERRQMALILAAWETARTQQTAQDQSRAEARAAMVPRPLPLSEHAQLREALETQMGQLRDYEVPSKALLSAKLDDIETNLPRLEDLRDVASMEDGEADMLQGTLDAATGMFKMKPARSTVALPRNPEELRLRHRRLGLAWHMARTRHRHKVWLQGDLVDAYRPPAWKILLRHIAPWRTQARMERDIGLRTRNQKESVPMGAPKQATKQAAQPAATPQKGASKGKGKGGRGTKKLHVKTTDGKAICFKYNNGDKCPGGCGFVHICQRCLGSHPKSKCSQLRNDTSKARPMEGAS
eukprot:s1418_g11.t1